MSSEYSHLAIQLAKQDEEFCRENEISKAAFDRAILLYTRFVDKNVSLGLSSTHTKAFVAGYCARLKEEIDRIEV